MDNVVFYVLCCVVDGGCGVRCEEYDCVCYFFCCCVLLNKRSWFINFKIVFDECICILIGCFCGIFYIGCYVFCLSRFWKY